MTLKGRILGNMRSIKNRQPDHGDLFSEAYQ